MQSEPDKVLSHYNFSSKPSFFFYRATVITSMIALVTLLGVNLYALNQPTSTTSKAAQLPTPSTPLVAPTASNAATNQANAPIIPTSTNGQALPPLPSQCHYEQSTNGTTIKCTEGGKSCIYRIVNDKYVMECDK